MSSEISLARAHRHATNAEDYTKEGLLALAAEEHLKSAETFQQCAEQTSDEGTKKTLKMLYNEHVKLGRDLQRKITKLQEEGRDPAQPYPPQSALPQNKTGNFRSRSPYDNARRPPYLSASSPRSGYSSPQIDESYMVLGNQSESHETFDRFWKSLEGMLDKLSQPVAFATAPLAQQGPPLENNSMGTNKSSQNQRTHAHKKTIADSFYEISEDVSDEDDDSSFFIVSPTHDSTSPLSVKKENEILKARVSELEARLQASERMRTEQEEQLRERVEAARREAHRVKASGILPPRPPLPLDLGSLNITVPGLSAISPNRETQWNRRIKELEDELKTLKLENERQKATITKFKERWDKLKDSAKKKRQAKLSSTDELSLAEQRIDEDPEAEANIDS